MDKSAKRKHRIDVGVACILKDGKYLIQSRPKGKTFTGMWEFPGGKRKKGESFQDCVKREILEEIGIKVLVKSCFLEELHHFEKVDLLLKFFHCKLEQGTPEPLEDQKIDWISSDNFSEIDFLTTNSKALEKLKNKNLKN